MSESKVIANQNRASILKKQGALKTIIRNQEKILVRLKK